MIKVVGIRFQRAGKIYYFDPLDYDLETAMHVIVETARGVEMGTVLIPPKEVDDDKVVQPLKPVIRIATDDDEKVIEKNKEKEAEAYVICKEKIAKHGLDMKLVAAEYTFDNNKLLFYFTADGRIDFRELVKDLASVFRTRIELRQIGVRDETKMLGGIGICDIKVDGQGIPIALVGRLCVCQRSGFNAVRIIPDGISVRLKYGDNHITIGLCKFTDCRYAKCA